jgi:hypothetical protein
VDPPSRSARRAASWLGPALAIVGASIAALVATRAWRAVECSRPSAPPSPAARAPLDPAALAAEGLRRLDAGEAARGEAILLFAEQRSRRDWRVEDALMDRAIAAGHWDEAMARADALLRTDGQGLVRPAVFRFLNVAAALPAPRAALVGRLGVAPPPWWREAYLRQLATAVARSLAPDPGGAATAPGDTLDPGSAAAVFEGLEPSPAPPLPDEYRPIVATLTAAGRYGRAIGLWRALARRADAAAPLRDGSFAREGDDTAFTWRRAAGVGASSEIVRSADGGALHVVYDGFGEPTLPAQLMVLAPGPYRLAWRERLIGPARLAWRVRCADAAVSLADGAALPPGSAAWAERALTFEVPAGGCPAQWVELVAAPGERRTDIDAWYGGFAVTGARAGRAIPPDPRR